MHIYIHVAKEEAVAQGASYPNYAHIDEFLEEGAKSSNLCESQQKAVNDFWTSEHNVHANISISNAL